MSTFLELAQILHDEVDGAGTGSDQVLSVVAQSGRNADYARWISQAYVDIQNRRNGAWRWLRRQFTLQTVDSDGEYAPSDFTDVLAAASIDRFGRWRFADPEDPPKIYLTSAGVGTERWLIWTEWDWFQHLYRIGTQNDGSPVFVSSDTQDNMVLGPVPNGIYTVTGYYWRSPQVLEDDADPDNAVPEMPSQFHRLIVWEAMVQYGYSQVASEVLARAELNRDRMRRQLENNQFPKFKTGIPLA
jgi:hypothetical protein